MIIFRLLGLFLFLFLYPFWAYLINILLDFTDCNVKNYLQFYKKKIANIIDITLKNPLNLPNHPKLICPDPNYVYIDKVWDTALITVAMVVSLIYWKPFTPILLIFYIYRMIGHVIYFKTGNRNAMVYFPSFFDVLYLIFYFLDYFHLQLNNVFLLVIIFMGFIGKLYIEYKLHYNQAKNHLKTAKNHLKTVKIT